MFKPHKSPNKIKIDGIEIKEVPTPNSIPVEEKKKPTINPRQISSDLKLFVQLNLQDAENVFETASALFRSDSIDWAILEGESLTEREKTAFLMGIVSAILNN